MELTELEYEKLSEDQKRLYRRKQASDGNYSLNRTAVKKLKRDKVDNEYTANSVHYEIGKKVRNAIIDIGGTMPEDLPTPSKSLKHLDKEKMKLHKKMQLLLHLSI